jgi:putative membrane protein
MQIFIIIALIIAVVAVIFALQNLAAVTVTFFFWSFHGSLALVLLLSVAAGVLISLLAGLPGMIRSRWTVASHKKKMVALESERNEHKTRSEEAEKEVRLLEEQLASLSAALEQAQQGQSADKSKP